VQHRRANDARTYVIVRTILARSLNASRKFSIELTSLRSLSACRNGDNKDYRKRNQRCEIDSRNCPRNSNNDFNRLRGRLGRSHELPSEVEK